MPVLHFVFIVYCLCLHFILAFLYRIIFMKWDYACALFIVVFSVVCYQGANFFVSYLHF